MPLVPSFLDRGRARLAWLFLALLALLASACAHVQAYDRAQHAHPTMTTDDVARGAEEHVRAIQEGAVGGGFSAGGGCGCN
jgi:hypothetical protein